MTATPEPETTDPRIEAAQFLRAEIDLMDEPGPIALTGMTSMAELLEAAAANAPHDELRSKIDAVAAAFLATKQDDELYERAIQETGESHKVTIEKIGATHLFVCSCSTRGEAWPRRAAATADGRRHTYGKTTELHEQLRRELTMAAA